MSESSSGAASVIDLGGVALNIPDDRNGIGIDYDLDQAAADFYSGVLDRLEKLGGLPRLLFVASASGSGREAGISAVGLARAVAGRNIRSLLVDASILEPTMSKPFPYQPDEGLVDMVLWGSSIQAALRKTKDEQIQFISVGSPPPSSEAVYQSNDLESVLNTFREQTDLVLIVGPLFNEAGELSPLLSRSDRTLVVRRVEESLPSIHAELPVGQVVEITIGKGLSGGTPEAIEPVTLVVQESVEPEDSISQRERRAPRPAPVTPKQAVSPPPREKRVKPASAVGPASTEEDRNLPVGRFILLFGAASIAIGLILSFFWIKGRFSPGESYLETAPLTEQAEVGTVGRGVEPAASPGEGSPPVADPVAEEGAEGEVIDFRSPTIGGYTLEEAVSSTGPGKTGRDGTGQESSGESTTPPSGVPVTGGEAEENAPAALSPISPTGGSDRQSAAQSARLYGVHVESFPTGMEADQAARPYMDAGFPVTIKVVDVPGKGTWHRIILGRVATKAEAEQYSREVKETFGLNYTLIVRIDE